MQTTKRSKFLIIGAGLSGLTSAYELYKRGHSDFLILESRGRIGGRIKTEKGIDLGATWFQTHHEQVIQLVDELGIKKFHQYKKGKSILVYSSMAPAHYFVQDPKVPSAYRIEGGSYALIEKLSESFQDKIRTTTRVTSMEEKGKEIMVKTNLGDYFAEKVILTTPPRIASQILYTPPLPDSLSNVLQNTHTWMSNAIKVGLKFDKAFWRDKDLSGTMLGQVSPVTELYDHSNSEDSEYSLMGFVNESLRDVAPHERKTIILDYLKKYLGEEILEYTDYFEKDWSQDKNTSNDQLKSIYMSPSYGDPAFDQLYMNGKLLFSGAETSPVHGGYMDGAVMSGIKGVTKLMNEVI